MEVGREVYSCGEDTLLVLTLRLAIELLPPFAEIMELRVEVCENLHFLATLVESVTHACIYLCDIAVRIVECLLFHLYGTCHEFLDVMACHCDGKKANRSEH